MPCPICGSTTAVKFSKGSYPIRSCDACTHQFVDYEPPASHVAELYGDDYFTGGGAGYRDYLADGEILIERGRRYGTLLAQHVKPGLVFDVGAAAGFLLSGMCNTGWQGCGIEPNERMADHARNALRLQVWTGQLETFNEAVSPDAVTVLQIAGHLLAPVQCFQRIYTLLRPGGLCLVETWNVRSWTARILGSRWPEYSPPTVLHFFSDRSLDHVAAGTGFTKVASGRPYKPISGQHLKSILGYKARDSSTFRLAAGFARAVPDRIRIRYPFDDLFWALYRRV